MRPKIVLDAAGIELILEADAKRSICSDRAALAELLARLPAGVDLKRLAVETKAIQRRREVVGGAALSRIALARGLSLRQPATWASMLGFA